MSRTAAGASCRRRGRSRSFVRTRSIHGVPTRDPVTRYPVPGASRLDPNRLCAARSASTGSRIVHLSLAAVALVLCALHPMAASAQQQRTNVSDARAAIDANLRTPQGKAYDAQIGADFMQKHFGDIARCKAAAAGEARSFWILLRIGTEGTANEILLYPETKFGACARDALVHGKFPPPPRPDYWVGVYMKLSH